LNLNQACSNRKIDRFSPACHQNEVLTPSSHCCSLSYALCIMHYSFRDITPQSPGGKILTCVFTSAGHAIIGIILGSFGHRSYSKKLELMKKMERPGTAGLGVFSSVDSPTPIGSFEYDIVSPSSSTATVSQPLPLSKIFSRRYSSLADFIVTIERSVQHSMDNISERITANRSFLKPSLKTMNSMVVFLFPLALSITIGAAVVGYLERWSWSDAIYWCTMTGTTVG